MAPFVQQRSVCTQCMSISPLNWLSFNHLRFIVEAYHGTKRIAQIFTSLVMTNLKFYCIYNYVGKHSTS